MRALQYIPGELSPYKRNAIQNLRIVSIPEWWWWCSTVANQTNKTDSITLPFRNLSINLTLLIQKNPWKMNSAPTIDFCHGLFMTIKSMFECECEFYLLQGHSEWERERDLFVIILLDSIRLAAKPKSTITVGTLHHQLMFEMWK